jgi:hypothetical protein
LPARGTVTRRLNDHRDGFTELIYYLEIAVI